MSSCEQTRNLSVYDHGLMVAEEYNNLLTQLISGSHEEPILLEIYDKRKHDLLPIEMMIRYQIFHDCGKPYCQSTDERKFPDHEKLSAQQWNLLFPDEKTISSLMMNDMKFHLAGNDDYISDPLAISSYFTAWAELYANATMFGGKESDSFKIKRKRLLKYGKLLKSALLS